MAKSSIGRRANPPVELLAIMIECRSLVPVELSTKLRLSGKSPVELFKDFDTEIFALALHIVIDKIYSQVL